MNSTVYNMASADVQSAPEPAALPDYLVDQDAVLKDSGAKWRYGKAPDYSKTRKVFGECKSLVTLSLLTILPPTRSKKGGVSHVRGYLATIHHQ